MIELKWFESSPNVVPRLQKHKVRAKVVFRPITKLRQLYNDI